MKAAPITPSHRAVRQSEGRSLRANCPRSSHSKTVSSRSGRDPLLLIEKSNTGRVNNLLPIRFTRMLESPFAFLRGTAAIQAHDLKTRLRRTSSCSPAGIVTWRTSAYSRHPSALIFDINDFDETFRAANRETPPRDYLGRRSGLRQCRKVAGGADANWLKPLSG